MGRKTYDGDVRVGVFPDCERIPILGAGFSGVTIRVTLALNKAVAKQALEILQTGLARCSESLVTRFTLYPNVIAQTAV
jgi:hypothetical protein